MNEPVIVSAARSPIGRHGGALSLVRPDDLAAHVIAAAAERVALDPSSVGEVIVGCANQAGEDCRNVARMASLLAGFPESVPGVTVNRLCGSGLEAIAQAARMIMIGDAEVVIAGGVESMSRAPHVVPKAKSAFATGAIEMADTTLGWRLVNPAMVSLGHTDSMGMTAENLANEYAIAREDQDAFALDSHAKAVAAMQAGRFDGEIVPVPVRVNRRTGSALVDADEGPRADSSLERLASLRPVFDSQGSVTAGNSSPLSDGAAVVVVTSRAYANASAFPVLASVKATGTAGVQPRMMGIGPVPASAKAFMASGIALEDVDLIELNEAFAAQALAVLREWKIDAEDERLNVNGGAIALGHPLGCSGTRIVVTLAHEMARRPDAEFALAAMCIGVGQGIALVLGR